jgi:PEGA domain-containing protein
MPRSTRLALSLIVSFVLAVPAVAAAQAVPRGSSSGSSSSGGSSGSSSGSSGGSTTSSSSGSSGGESGSSNSGSNSGATVSRAPSRIPTSGSHSSPSRISGATPRSAPEPGGIVSGGGGRSGIARAGDPDNVRPGSPGGVFTSGRSSTGRGTTGIAVPRRVPDTSFVAFPLYGPWGNWYPWYGSGFGWNLGFVYYNPWRYGATSWLYGRYGLWYDPWAYDPYGWSPYYSGYGYSSGAGYDNHGNNNAKRMTGSIRLRVKPSAASVYIDGALVGTVDEFDGFSDHLELDGGMHKLELRAEGYETYSGQIDVEVGKTVTERVSLKKVKK